MSIVPLEEDHPWHPLNQNDFINGRSENSYIGVTNKKRIKSDLSSVLDFTIEETTKESEESILEDSKNIYPSSGDIMKQSGLSDSEDFNPITKEQEATNFILGTTKNLKSNILEWQKELAGDYRETFYIMMDTLPSAGVVSLEPLIKEMELGYKTSMSVSKALEVDYDSGNSFEKVNNIKQLNTGQYRVNTTNVSSFNSPLFFVGSKQTLFQAEQLFIQSDISHTTCKHFWLRAEWGENYCSFRRNSYIIDENVTYAANDVNYAGGREFYSDSFNNRIGTLSFSKLHPQRSRGGGYGSFSNTSVSNQNYRSTLGNINSSAMFNITINSVVGLVLINSWGLGTIIGAASGALGQALSHPTNMQDPPELKKRDFTQPGVPSVSIDSKTPEGSNTDIGKGSGAYRGLFGTQSTIGEENFEQYKISDEENIISDENGIVNERWR
mgnify:CR=1 FL=1